MMETDFLAKFTEIAKSVEKDKQLPEFTREAKITSLGIDSVAMMEIIGVLEDDFNIVIPDEKLATLQTVGDIERIVREQSGRA